MKMGDLAKVNGDGNLFYGYGTITEVDGRHRIKVLWIDDGDDNWTHPTHVEVVYES